MQYVLYQQNVIEQGADDVMTVYWPLYEDKEDLLRHEG